MISYGAIADNSKTKRVAEATLEGTFRLFGILVEQVGFMGALLVVVLWFINTNATSEQKKRIIDMYVLGQGISIVWPKDGALVSPVTMLVKTGKRAELQPLIDFLSGAQAAVICADAGFPALHPGVDNRLPDDAAFKWIGWEYVKKNDIKSMLVEINATFLQAFKGDVA